MAFIVDDRFLLLLLLGQVGMTFPFTCFFLGDIDCHTWVGGGRVSGTRRIGTDSQPARGEAGMGLERQSRGAGLAYS